MKMGLWNLWQEGGSFMYPIFGLGVSTLLVGIIGAVMRARGLAYAALGCLAFCLLHGFGAYYLGMGEVDLAVATVSPDMAEAIRERGTEIARVPLFFALVMAVPGAVAVAVAWMRSTPATQSA